METLYSKLYDKYTKLKATKASAIEQLNFDQEQKFKTYVSAADELIGYLSSEKDKLCAQINDLRQEVASIRSAKDEEQEKYEKILMEENLRNKELCEEIEMLRRKEFHASTSNDVLAIKKLSGSSLSSGRISKSTKRKQRQNMNEKEVGDMDEDALADKSEDELDKENMFSGANQPKCCRRRLGSSVNTSTCLFQELVECLLDLKFSVVPQAEDILIAAVHESSGYSFSLGWVGEEELMYRVSSLGTFERVAPEWMRDVMLFSKNMCRIFFERLSSILKHHD